MALYFDLKHSFIFINLLSEVHALRRRRTVQPSASASKLANAPLKLKKYRLRSIQLYSNKFPHMFLQVLLVRPCTTTSTRAVMDPSTLQAGGNPNCDDGYEFSSAVLTEMRSTFADLRVEMRAEMRAIRENIESHVQELRKDFGRREARCGAWKGI